MDHGLAGEKLLAGLLRVAHFDQMLPSSGGYQSHVCNLVNRCFGTVISHYIRKSLSTSRLSHRIRLIVQQESNAEPNSPLEPHPFYSWNLRLSQPELSMHYSTNSKNVNTFMWIFAIILCYYCKITTNRPVWWT